MIDQERLSKITTLEYGKHDPDGQFCIMEAAAFIAGEKWSDHPECVCPVIGTFMRAWNDGLPSDEERNRLLLPLLPRLVGTRGSKALEERRSLMAGDWLVRVHIPAWLRLAKLDDQAKMLEALPEITSMAQVPSIRGPLEAVRKDAAAARAAAWDAATAAARAAARAAAWDAAVTAARGAARAAANAAARNAAWDAAWDAAVTAARATARAAAWDALKETTTHLQQSALALVDRMILAADE